MTIIPFTYLVGDFKKLRATLHRIWLAIVKTI